ncbi:MAG: hypothetical protein LBP69_05100 [Treponema sp.]|jgi:hypothetical protein|nr:hypothetical protein [Treponema sp.]
MKQRALYPVFAALFLVPVLSLSAQTAEELDRMLETRAVSAAAAARFALGAAELLPEYLFGADAEKAAYTMAFENGWLACGPGDTLRLRDTAFLVMNAFGIKGGIMYSILHNPRYAYREMVYKKLIQGGDPGAVVSGEKLLHIIGSALRYSGEDERLDAEIRGWQGELEIPGAIGR